jgi:hypothetical protein
MLGVSFSSSSITILLLIVVLLGMMMNDISMIQAQTYDLFNYGDTKEDGNINDYGPKDWGKISCNDVDTCVRSLF